MLRGKNPRGTGRKRVEQTFKNGEMQNQRNIEIREKDREPEANDNGGPLEQETGTRKAVYYGILSASS